MAREKKHNLKIGNSNKHLLNVFSDDLYLELGSIDYDPLNDLLNKKMVEYNRLSALSIINKGLGSMRCDSEELSHKLPFLKLNNIVEKNKSCQLVLTYGLLLRRQGYKENFTPIILIPVRMFFENDTIMFRMLNKPLVNPHILSEVDKMYDSTEKLDSIHNMDKFILTFLNNHTHNVRYENYMTVMNVSQPEINVRHEKYKIDTSIGSSLIDGYKVTSKNDYYNITPLDKTQRTILAMASEGSSFAITGYEGTGKTTTLLNIAANAIKNGQRVLYVSNNDSTLKYVSEKFKEYDLNPYVSLLTESFSKINERSSDIKRGQVIEPVLKNELKQKYDYVENICNQYASKIKNYLLIEIMKELIVTQRPDELFDEKIMKNAYRLYRHEINEVLAAVAIIEKEMVKIPSFINSHFINIPITHKIKNYKEPLALIQNIYLNYCILNEKKDVLEKKYGFSTITDYALFINKIKDYGKINKTKVPSSWLKIDDEKTSIKDKFSNFLKAKKLFDKFQQEISAHDEIEKVIENLYRQDVFDFDVKNAIKLINGKYFNIKTNEVDVVLKDYSLLNSELDKALDLCDDLEIHFAKLKSRLGFTIDITNVPVINQILDFIFVLDKGYFSKVWCNYENRDGIYRKMVNIESTLDKYHECLKLYNKYFDNVISNLEIHINSLERKNRDENSKYKKITVAEVLDALYFLRNNHGKVSQMEKEYKDLTYAEYKYNVHISDIYNEFMQKHDLIDDKNSRIQIENNFQDLRGSGVVDVLVLAKEYRNIEENIEKLYNFFESYSLLSGANSLVEMIEQIRDIKKYVKNVVKCQRDMKNILKADNDSILFKDYLILLQNLNTRKNINEKINSNEEYKFLYEGLFKGSETNVNQIKQSINDFELYINVFKNPHCLIKSFQPFYNEQIVLYLNSAEKIIYEIGELFKRYVKMFKTNISKFYYDDFKKIINYFKDLIEAKEELQTYLIIADQMKVLLKYKLFNLNNFIIYNNHELVGERLKYSYFLHLYEEFKEANPEFTKHKYNESLMDSIIFLENDLLDNNRLIIKISNKNFSVGKARYLNYNGYIEKNKNNKMLFLTDTQIANQYLNMDLFDIVIIDDAHLLNANEYYKVITAKQVILSGNEQIQTSINNNLISRMRSSNVIKLRYKYNQTPLKLLAQYQGVSGRFYSDIELNDGIEITSDDYNSVLIDLLRNKPNYKVNFFTSSLNIMHEIIKNVGSVWYDKDYSVSEIYTLFKYNLNVSDLTIGYMLDAEYNVLHLDSYSDVNDEVIVFNMINNLMSCRKKLIIIDNKNHLNSSKPSLLVQKLNEVINYTMPKLVLRENNVITNISKALSRHQIKTVMVSSPLHLIVEYNNKYHGIMLLENPGNTEFTLLNEFREYKAYDFPIVIVWLPNLIDNFGKTISDIIKDIKS